MTPPTTQASAARGGFASIVVRLAGIWILAGALAKLFLGTPKDLPQLVRDLAPFDLDRTFHLVIGIELSIVCLAFIKPRLAWPVILALFVFFDFILVSQLLAGAKSCGCFGATIKVPPWVMLSVDSALLVSLLASRPWSVIRGPGLSAGLLAAGVVASLGLPWLVIRAPEPGSVGPARYVIMDPAKWVNRSIYEVEDLTRWVKPEEFPTDGRIVLWRQGCDHCAAHLRRMAGQDDGTQPILLVQIRDDLKDGRAVDLMPQGPHVTNVALPENQQVVLQTPWEIRVEGGIVKFALDEEHAKLLYEKGG
jgi:hypothetical protein